ncbi:MAG: polysaccharide biosynthesis tyrosine autokinase, partial [Actinomycetia bacterium]|nr:polysaccharide biosynthesis tyrosine autokinase [Actinomycetes bacterium]
PESLKKELELSSNTYALLLSNYENLRISQTLESYGANIIEAAIIPESPIKPNKRLFLIVSLLIGLVLGAGIVILKEYLDNTIKNSDDAEKYYGLKVISQVVYNKAMNVKQRELVSLKDPNSLTHESIKELRTNIGYFNVDKKIKIIGITSAMLEEGKSFLSANLAAALAQSGLKILLLNADFRKPVLHKYFNHRNRSGITTVLTGYTKLSDGIESTVVENMDFLPSGPIPPNPSELLESEAMGISLEDVSKRYDYIIVDTSPIVPVTDFIVLAKKLDAIIVVSRVRFVTKAIAKEAALKLAVFGRKVLGIVLNGVIRKGSYYYYYK